MLTICHSRSITPSIAQLSNTVHVCTSSWVVLSLQQPLCGDMETWVFGAWRPWTAE